MVSPEGLPLKSYSKSGLLAAFPLALTVFGLTKIMRLFSREEHFFSDQIPADSILYAYHTEVMGSFIADSFRCQVGSTWIGYHGVLSYVGSLEFILNKEPCFRYHKKHKSKNKPKAQIIDFLEQHQGRVYIRTDAGGPYNQVKGSLIDLAIDSGRPLVAVRHIFDKQLIFFKHKFPRPFASLRTVHSRPIYPEELLRYKNRSDAISFIQRIIDDMQYDKKS